LGWPFLHYLGIDMNEYYFSIIIPLYNKENHILDCLKSIFNQDYSNYEIIVVNDASTDSSREIVKDLNHPAIRLFDREQPSPGGAAARNLGIEQSQYDHIAFLDADDFWDVSFLRNMNVLINKCPNVQFYSSGWYQYFPSSHRYVPNNYVKARMNIGEQILDLKSYLKLSLNKSCPVWTSCCIVNQSLLKKINGFKVSKCASGVDIDTWIRIMLVNDKLAVTPKPLAYYNREAENMVTKSTTFNTSKKCIYDTIVEEYANKQLPYPVLMKKYSNHHHLLNIKRKLLATGINKDDLKYLFFIANPFIVTLLYAISFLPAHRQEMLVKLLFKRSYTNIRSQLT
jgi:glycosyltransferase involved in cell wall biosynthesis